MSKTVHMLMIHLSKISNKNMTNVRSILNVMMINEWSEIKILSETSHELFICMWIITKWMTERNFALIICKYMLSFKRKKGTSLSSQNANVRAIRWLLHVNSVDARRSHKWPYGVRLLYVCNLEIFTTEKLWMRRKHKNFGTLNGNESSLDLPVSKIRSYHG
jgi:hypothetical protein